MRTYNVSINREKLSPYWQCSFTGPKGTQLRRSTKVPVGGGVFQGEKLSAKQAEKRAMLVAAKIAEAEYAEHETHNNTTVRHFLEDYLRRRSSKLSPGGYRNDKAAFERLLKWLGKRADQPLRLFTRADAKAYAEQRRAEVRNSTVVREIGSFKTAFNDAVDSDIIPKNVWLRLYVQPETREEEHEAEPFTIEELRYIIAHFPPEWASAVRCSFETYGQRLADIRLLKWSQFDWEKRVVRFTTKKTRRKLEQPMRDEFYDWARVQYEAAGCNDNAYLHPRLASRTDSISWEFSQLLAMHGIGVTHVCNEGKKRCMRSKTFHSIRRTAATYLQASGVAQGVATKLVGHSSDYIHSLYVKPHPDQLRDAANKLPEL